MFKLFRRSKKLALIALSLKRSGENTSKYPPEANINILSNLKPKISSFSASELLLFVLVWGLGVIIFSVIMYYAEGDKNPRIDSILAAR